MNTVSFKGAKIFVLLLTYLAVVGAMAQDAPAPRTATADAILNLEKDIPVLMKKARIPGLSIALIRNGKIVWTHAYGVTNASTKEKVTENTVFEAASLTKVVVAYSVLRLVDEGKLDLDVPLNKYLGNNYEVGDDPRLDKITARRVLTHSSGFPNWRNGAVLPINFQPGEKFSYSGEGFVYLSKVIEKVTGIKFEDFVQQKALGPLGMASSSLVWRDDYNALAVHRHDLLGNVSFRNEKKEVNAAASLRTTASDYAKFVVALLKGTGLKKKTLREMLKPAINVDLKSPEVFWGLGVGLEVTESGKSFWHWGDQGDSKAYVTANIKGKDAVVFFANSVNGLSITKEILNDAIGGQHPSVAYLDYAAYNSASFGMTASILEKGAVAAISAYQDGKKGGNPAISEDDVNSMGYALMNAKRLEDAIEVFKMNTNDFPQSANTWDSLAEAYMNQGDKPNAIKYYEKSLELNPDNNGAKEKLKKLRM